MTSINNYNCNKDGNDIEFSGFMDGGKSQSDFDENFETLQSESYSKTSIQFYNPAGEITQNLDIKVGALKPELYKFVDNFVNAYVDKTSLKQELYDHVIQYLEEELPAYKYNVAELAQAHNIDVSYVNDIEILVTRGYGQGDYALVLVDRTQLAKLWGKYTDNIQELINHYFWDSPVWAKLDINGEEYSYFDYDLKEYEWEREAFIKHVSKAANVPLDELESLVPEDLGHI